MYLIKTSEIEEVEKKESSIEEWEGHVVTDTSPRGNEFVCFQLKDEATTYYTLSAKSIRVNPASSRCCFLN